MTQSSEQAIVPSKVIEAEIVDEPSVELRIQQSKGANIVRVRVPNKIDDLTLTERAALLQGAPQWAQFDGRYLLYLLGWADKNGYDIFKGDVYVVDGRPATTDEAKISNALKTGRVEYLTCSGVEKVANPFSGANDFAVTATLKLKGEEKPRSYTAFLSEWKNPKNLAWQKYPTDRLRRKAMARVCSEAVPTGDGEDFIPVPSTESGGLKAEVQARIEQAEVVEVK